LQHHTIIINNHRVIVGILIAGLVLFPVVGLTTGLLRIILALPFVVFLPGYTLLLDIFPRQNDIAGCRRIILSSCLSIIIVVIIGLVLNYTPWGITPFPILTGTFLFILLTASIAWYRQHNLPVKERLRYTVEISFSRWLHMNGPGRILSVIMVIAVLTVIGSLGYAMTTPDREDAYTEFYIRGPSDNATEIPQEATTGQPVQIMVVVINHEHEALEYHVEIVSDGTVIDNLTTGTLDHEEQWRTTTDFILTAPGENQKVKFYLYTDTSSEPYFKEPLFLFLDVE